MRRMLLVATAAAVMILFAWCGTLRADHERGTLGDRGATGYKQAVRHNPYSRHYADYLPAGHRRFGRYSPGFGYSGGGFSYGYYGPYDYGYGGGYAGPYYGGGYYVGYPLIYSAQDLFGANLERLWNPYAGQAPRPQVNINILDAPPEVAGPPLDAPLDGGPVQPLGEPMPQVRPASAEALTRAWRFIEIGDRYFQKQEYRQAYQRYKEAAQAAPALVEAYLRQGQAMLATGQHAIAAVSFKRGLKLAPDWSQVRFDLTELYADRTAARKAHLESLATAAEQNPGDGDLLLLIGVQLHFSGDADRARLFLRKAAGAIAADDGPLATIVEDLAAEPIAAEVDDAIAF